MSIFYDTYTLDISVADVDRIVSGCAQSAITQNAKFITGVPLTTLEETKHLVDSGFLLIGNDEKTKMIGAGYIDSVGNRVWIYNDGVNSKLFIDGSGVVINQLGLIFDGGSKTIKLPVSGEVVLQL